MSENQAWRAARKVTRIAGRIVKGVRRRLQTLLAEPQGMPSAVEEPVASEEPFAPEEIFSHQDEPAAQDQASDGRAEPQAAAAPKPPLRPFLSIVIVVQGTARELPRTLTSLEAGYQRHVAATDYELIVVDNGCATPVAPSLIDSFRGAARLIRTETASFSPAPAINLGLHAARGEIIGVIADGTGLATPGLVHFAIYGAALYPRAVVVALHWRIGAEDAQSDGGRGAADAILDTIQWPEGDGYRLFELGAPDVSSVDGWLAPITIPNSLFMRRETWDLLGGVDERFDLPGGGLLHRDTFSRALALHSSELVMLLGEGTFLHGHDALPTKGPSSPASRREEAERQYHVIRGRAYAAPAPKRIPTYIGPLPEPVRSWFARTALQRSSRSPSDPA